MASIPSTPVDGKTRVLFVPVTVDLATVNVGELTTGTGLFDVSNYLTGDGWNDGGDQATIADDRLADTETYSQPGRKSNTLTIRYVTNPGDLTNDAAATTLVEGLRGYFVVRDAVPYTDAYAIGQLVEVWPVRLGVQRTMSREANSVLRIEQPTFITGPVRRRVAIVA